MALATQIPAISLLAVSVLVICNFVLTASGLFPAEDSVRERFGPMGAVGLYFVLALVFLLVLHLIAFTVAHTVWYFAIITTGLMLLASPWIHQLLPRQIQDGIAGVFAIGGCAAVMHMALFSL